MGSVSMYQLKKIVLMLAGFSFSVSRFLLALFNLIVSPLFRFKSVGISSKNDYDGVGAISAEKCKEDSNSDQYSDEEVESNDVGDSVKVVEEEKEEFSFTFKFPTYDEFTRIKKEKGDLFPSDFVFSPDNSKGEFTVGHSDCLSIKEPEIEDLVGDLCGSVSFEEDENEHIKVFDGNSVWVSSDGVKTENSEPEDFIKEIEETVEKEHSFLVNQESPSELEIFSEEIEEKVEKKHNFLVNQESHSELENFTEEIEETVEKEHNFLVNLESISEPEDFSKETEQTVEKELGNQEFPSEPEAFTKETEEHVEKEQNFLRNQESPSVPDHDQNHLWYQTEKEHIFLGNQESPSISDHDEDPLGYQIDSHSDSFLSEGDFVDEADYNLLIEESTHFDEEDIKNVENSITFKPYFLSENDFHEDDDDSKITDLKDSYNFGDSNKLESLWEHQELIQLLHIELKKAKAINLPTILEEEELESDGPQLVEDYKPWKSDEKFNHVKCIEEINKFYKYYTQLMKKLDIFNYQKMYTIGLLRLKDPLQTISTQKTSGQMFRHKVNERDPQEEFVKEIQIDLEVVYVGQMCLSWELLRWQYGKALDLWDYNPPGIHRYNEVAGEFQRFQVLIQRFIEDEPFQEPRVQYYIKTRLVNRDLLQVPLIKEDSPSSRNKRKGESSEYVITSDQLVEIVEESIRILLRFIRADKETCNSISKGHKGSPMPLQNLSDFELLNEIKHVLQKKEKKIKEMRSGKFVFGRFGSRREEDSEQVLKRFYSEVDMKLVRRVLNMSKITSEQLLWCHTKLNRISVEHKKLDLDSSFLAFPVNIF